jgi:hypothetical protein
VLDADEASGPIVPDTPSRSARIRRAQEAEARQRAEELLALRNSATASEQPSEPKPYGPFDLLLYPFSLSGTITLVAMIVYPVLLGLLGAFGPLHLLLRTRLSLMINGVAGLYVGWYLAECVYDSARGGTRAPEALDMGGLGDLWSRFSYLAAVYIIYGLPAVLYGTIAQRFDAVFWILVGWAIVFVPMGLLAMVINDSVSALNPLFLLDSIRRVFIPYMGLLVLIAGLVGLCWLLPIVLSQGAPPIWFAIIALVVSAYGLFLFAHILGRFYWRHHDRLDWGL